MAMADVPSDTHMAADIILGLGAHVVRVVDAVMVMVTVAVAAAAVMVAGNNAGLQ